MELPEKSLDHVWQFHPDVALEFTQIPETRYPAWVKCDNWRKDKTSQNVNSSGTINLAVPICNTSPFSNRAHGFLQHRGSFYLDRHNMTYLNSRSAPPNHDITGYKDWSFPAPWYDFEIGGWRPKKRRKSKKEQIFRHPTREGCKMKTSVFLKKVKCYNNIGSHLFLDLSVFWQ